ncbi:MAG: OpgC domain-containing protein [Candidatus Thiodiazotropha sp. 6PLUC2]
MERNNRWAYPALNKRDLRLDFMRGLIMIYVVIVHLEYYSLFSLLAWERLGIISSAEGFVLLSGIVVGIVYGNRAKTEGLLPTSKYLWRRAFKLYRVNIFVILSIPLLGLLSFIDVHDVSHWWVPAVRTEAYDLYPVLPTPWWTWLWKTLMLKIGPHQFQIIGLYVVLLSLAPLAILALIKGYVVRLLLISWGLYIANLFLFLHLTPARFELGFPLLTWQLLFFNGVIVGFYREQVLGWLVAEKSSWMGRLAAIVCLGFILLAFNAPDPLFWPWPTLSLIPSDTYLYLHGFWFDKTLLGPGRLLNNAALFITMYILLSRYWSIFDKALGWLLIPLGQASLYVFTIHIYVILLVSNLPIPLEGNFLLGTMVHASAIALIWLMVKHRILFNWIPR